ncbi:MAG: lysophospholipase [Oscillospiraceae bacterium]|jgi:alpha-beta hydrolase superfamily lysophospholipase|nr:lysophospholipase [Oscillospiraceae bacterium]MDD3261829.1 lysophospholipase [Oscillospiraceae bacterium]
MYIKSFDDTKLFLNKETAPEDKCVCVIVHGLAEHQGRYDYLAQKFHQNGIGTYRFDLRGHGRSDGERAYYACYQDMLKDVDTVVEMALTENPKKPVFLLGHSMGGFAVALYGAAYPNKRLAGLITNGAVTRDNAHLLSGVPEGADPHQRIPNQMGDGVCSVRAVVDWYQKDPYNCMTFTAGICMAIRDGISWFAKHGSDFYYPVLMMHGEKDGLVSVKDTQEFFGMISSEDKQMKIYGKLFHEVFNEYRRDEAISDVIHWINNRI